jgi:RimJ/RimL family protein N-acetyltransferase
LPAPGVASPALIVGRRVKLRHASCGFTEEEIRQRYRWGLDEDLQYWSGSIPTAASYELFRTEVLRSQHVREPRRDSFAILDGRGWLVGMISYYNIVEDRGQAELGIYLGERSVWNHGYGSDAVVTLLGYLFRETSLQVMYLSTYATNERAQACYRKCGFQATGTMRKYSSRAGYYTDVQMKVLRNDFLTRFPQSPLVHRRLPPVAPAVTRE